ncbi:hypothetical protein V6N11_007424 [Hibiscus sabdariffa]|uniref:Uncharacterized protein n=2 Tax=Hibiscus sabdariffa TaxID=183260 RepID=A0ABR2CB66_9ROSI
MKWQEPVKGQLNQSVKEIVRHCFGIGFSQYIGDDDECSPKHHFVENQGEKKGNGGRETQYDHVGGFERDHESFFEHGKGI